MYKTLCFAMLLAALVPLAGCGQSADSLVQQQVDQMNELADALESGADKATLDEIGQRMKTNDQAIKDLNLSDAEKQRLSEKFGEEAGKATARVMKASMSKMGGMMEGVMKGMSEGMQGKMPEMPKGFPQPPKVP